MSDIEKMIAPIDGYAERDRVIRQFFKHFLDTNPEEFWDSGLTLTDFMIGDFAFVSMYIQFETVMQRAVKAKNAIEVKLLGVKTVCDVCKSENDVKMICANDIDVGQPISHLTLCKRCKEILKNKL